MTLNISEILKGCTSGKMQSVGYMQIIPLMSKFVDDNIAPPTEVSYSNKSYGGMDFVNKSADKTAIIPFCCGIMTNQTAQNHGIPNTKCLSPSSKSSIMNAACIQETQGGYINDDGKHKITILPWSIKEATFITRQQHSYSKLWPSIREFNHQLNIKDTNGQTLNRGHLEFYMKNFKDELDEFIGQYEMEPNMVGCIILMNGEVVGIERSPNHSYWKSIWEPLIRESYGSLALMYRKQFGDNPPPPKTRIPIDSHGINSISKLKDRLLQVTQKETGIIKRIINSFIKKKFKHEVIETVNSYKVEAIQNDQFLGQIVTNNSNVSYCSLITTADWIKNPTAHSWTQSTEFSM